MWKVGIKELPTNKGLFFLKETKKKSRLFLLKRIEYISYKLNISLKEFFLC